MAVSNSARVKSSFFDILETTRRASLFDFWLPLYCQQPLHIAQGFCGFDGREKPLAVVKGGAIPIILANVRFEARKDGLRFLPLLAAKHQKHLEAFSFGDECAEGLRFLEPQPPAVLFTAEQPFGVEYSRVIAVDKCSEVGLAFEVLRPDPRGHVGRGWLFRAINHPLKFAHPRPPRRSLLGFPSRLCVIAVVFGIFILDQLSTRIPSALANRSMLEANSQMQSPNILLVVSMISIFSASAWPRK